MERDQRGLDREGGEQPDERRPALDGRVLEQVAQGVVVEARGPAGAPLEVVQPEDADEHEQPAEQGIDEELTAAKTARRPPQTDQEVGRDQHRLPEDVEQEQVEAGEGPEQGGLQDQQEAR